MLSPPPSGIISFGSFHLDPRTGSLEKHGVPVRLPRQHALILKLLAQRVGEIVTREQLRDEVWGTDTFVDFEHGLNAAINKLRQTLGDSAEKPRFIETLPGRGYRFIAAVRLEPQEQSTGQCTGYRAGFSASAEWAPRAVLTATGLSYPADLRCLRDRAVLIVARLGAGALGTFDPPLSARKVHDFRARGLCIPARGCASGICSLTRWLTSRVHSDGGGWSVPPLDSRLDEPRAP